MLMRTTELIGFELLAQDGTLGKVKDVLFDDHDFNLRYLVVDTGKFLSGREVLISPSAVASIDRQGIVVAHLTQEQVKNSPDIKTDMPVSRQEEASLHQYYGWPYYWVGMGMWTTGAYPVVAPQGSENASRGISETQESAAERAATEARRRESIESNHLRSCREIKGYRMHSNDDEVFGRIEDFLFDDQHWTLDYFVVDTINWVPSRSVLLQSSYISSFDWGGRFVHLNVTMEVARAAPDFEPTRLPNHPDSISHSA